MALNKDEAMMFIIIGALKKGSLEASIQDAKDALATTDAIFKETFPNDPLPPSRAAILEAITELEQTIVSKEN